VSDVIRFISGAQHVCEERPSHAKQLARPSIRRQKKAATRDER
jgi:hypothetical protein